LKCAQFIHFFFVYSLHSYFPHTLEISLSFDVSILKFPPCVSPQIKLAAVRKRYHYLDLRHFVKKTYKKITGELWCGQNGKCNKRYL